MGFDSLSVYIYLQVTDHLKTKTGNCGVPLTNSVGKALDSAWGSISILLEVCVSSGENVMQK